LGAKLVQGERRRFVSVRAALQRSAWSWRGADAVHRRCAFVHEGAAAACAGIDPDERENLCVAT